MILLSGTKIREERQHDFTAWANNRHLVFVILQIGDDDASDVYIRSLRKYGERTGVEVKLIRLSKEISQAEAIEQLQALNNAPEVTGIMLASPMPAHIDETEMVKYLNPSKDIEGVHPYNLGILMSGNTGVKPATPKSAVSILKGYGITLVGKKVVVIGRSIVVGLPLANMLIKESATVTICHSQTRNLTAITKTAEILISAVGKPGFITPDMVNPEAVVIDIGTNVLPNGTLVGDVDPAVIEQGLISAITPVPGGVGALTVVEMFDNLRFLTKE